MNKALNLGYADRPNLLLFSVSRHGVDGKV